MDVVLVHGLIGSAGWWDRVVPTLAARHAVRAVDLPRREPEKWLEQLVVDLDRPALVGHSLGALYAARVASRSPVGALVLVAPAGLPPARGVLRLGPPLVSALRLAGPAFLPSVGRNLLRYRPRSFVAGARLALGGGLDLSEVQAPVLVVWGERDRVCPARPVDARSVTVRGAGHVPMWERPEALAKLLLDFLEEVEGQAR
ncbi:MAG: alpha/beta fold hydrolase [Thermoleophilia bacterium]|nr:alpha/beta fold hydrolase [Thermoleophilia bacterium]